MKVTIFILFTLMFGLSQSVLAEQNSIDAQIAAIQKAAPKERVQLMNALKRKLMQMNTQQRLETIKKMRHKFAKNSAQHAEHSEDMRHNTRQMQEHMQHKEMDHMQEMEHMQNMRQHDAAQQYMQERPEYNSGGGQQMSPGSSTGGGGTMWHRR